MIFDKNKGIAYLGLIFVIILWGISPLITLEFYKYYSPTIRIAFSSLVCVIALTIISWKKRKLLDKSYLKAAIPTGLFLSLADILQKIGLQYTTPTNYAFLENLSVLAVPILLFFFIKKKPSVLTRIAVVLCLFSSFVLTGLTTNINGTALVGDLLCALAGIFYGVNIAGTGVYAKKLYTPLYLLIQMSVEAIVSFISAIVFDATGIERIMFNFSWELLVSNVAIVFITSTLCWLIRTNAMKVVDPTVIAVMMPFSSVITTVLSVFAGKDMLSSKLVIGVLLGLASIILSGLADRKES